MKNTERKKKNHSKAKAKLKKPASEKKAKRAKPDEHEEAEPALELDAEEPEELGEGDEKPPMPRRKGRPPKSTAVLDDEDDFDPDAIPDNDEVGDQDLTIPRKPRKNNGTANSETARNGDDPNKAPTRIGLIRARHEAMRREIDQIREDLESDEEE